MDWSSVIGFAAGFFTTVSFVPQITKIWKSKSAEDVSKKMFLAVAFGVSLWLVYGMLLQQWPIIIWNSISLVLASTILFLKYKFG